MGHEGWHGRETKGILLCGSLLNFVNLIGIIFKQSEEKSWTQKGTKNSKNGHEGDFSFLLLYKKLELLYRGDER